MRISTFVITKNVSNLTLENSAFHKFVYSSLHRFQCHDWGDVCEEDRIANDEALKTGDRILAVYETDLCVKGKIWIIADAADEDGKRIVTVLFPSEY